MSQSGSPTVSAVCPLTAPYTVVLKPVHDGEWIISTVYQGDTYSTNITLSAWGTYYAELKYRRIYGVSWNGSSSTVLTRTDDSADFANPVSQIGTSEGSSPFDSLYPWSEMKEYNVINSAISYEKGVDAEFSRTTYDTVVKIPKFWYKVTSEGSTWTCKIANVPYEDGGFQLHPAFNESDEIYIGKYITGGGYVSRSGKSPVTNITRATFRDNARNKGANWDTLNIATYSALMMLYLVEYADWNSQNCVGKGYTNGSAAITTGGTDLMTYHTGRPAGTDELTSIQYRGIEDLWGNAWQFVDGINFNGNIPYYCFNRANFGDDKSTGYFQLGFNVPGTSGSWQLPKSHGVDQNAPWLILPNATGGSDASYIPDGWMSDTGWRIFLVGGYFAAGSRAGLFARVASNASSIAAATLGGRLIFIPSEVNT